MKKVAILILVTFVFGCGTDEQPDNSSVVQQLTDEECRDLDKKRRKATKGHKVAICHVPPGNPANAHTIVISENAVQTHFDRHNDYIGICGCGEDDPGDDPIDTPNEPEEPSDPQPEPEPDPEPQPEPETPVDYCAGMSTCVIDSDCGNQQACDDLTLCCVQIIQ